MPRVMLERPRDYLQILVDLGCHPAVLSTVIWNPATRAVDVSSSVYLRNKDLTKLPFQFGTVGGSFGCAYNRLTNLDGAPRTVGGDFGCSRNRLTSLDGAPREVGGRFIIDVALIEDFAPLLNARIGELVPYSIDISAVLRARRQLHEIGYSGKISALDD